MQFSKLRTVAVAAIVMNTLFAARPFNTDDAGIVAPSGFELELGTDMWQDDALFGMSIKYGLTNRIDVGVNLGYTMLPDSVDGFENTEIGFKFAILPNLISTSFTAILGDLDYVLYGIVTRAFGPLEVDMNLGFVTTGLGGIDGDVMYGLAAIYTIDKFALGVEAAGDQDAVQTWLAGVRYGIFPSLSIDGGIIGGFWEKGDILITAGMHYEF
jgi:hypothetical protein